MVKEQNGMRCFALKATHSHHCLWSTRNFFRLSPIMRWIFYLGGCFVSVSRPSCSLDECFAKWRIKNYTILLTSNTLYGNFMIVPKKTSFGLKMERNDGPGIERMKAGKSSVGQVQACAFSALKGKLSLYMMRRSSFPIVKSSNQ